MALIRKRNYKKMVVYLVLVLAVIGFGGYLLYNTFFVGGGGRGTPTNTATGRDRPIIDDYSENLLNNSVYQGLDDFGAGQYPLDYQNIDRGRNNPFSL